MTQQSKKQTMEESRKIWAQIDPLTKRRNEITARKHQILKLIKKLENEQDKLQKELDENIQQNDQLTDKLNKLYNKIL